MVGLLAWKWTLSIATALNVDTLRENADNYQEVVYLKL